MGVLIRMEVLDTHRDTEYVHQRGDPMRTPWEGGYTEEKPRREAPTGICRHLILVQEMHFCCVSLRYLLWRPQQTSTRRETLKELTDSKNIKTGRHLRDHLGTAWVRWGEVLSSLSGKVRTGTQDSCLPRSFSHHTGCLFHSQLCGGEGHWKV